LTLNLRDSPDEASSDWMTKRSLLDGVHAQTHPRSNFVDTLQCVIQIQIHLCCFSARWRQLCCV